jgi:hypothetical protein
LIVISFFFSHIFQRSSHKQPNMMFSSNTCRFVVCFLSMALSATAETVRGVHRELEETATVDLGTAGDYAILTKTGISTVPTSAITGNIAVSPIAATAITGFVLMLDSGTQFSTSTQVVGKATAASYGGAAATLLTTAVSNMETAYTDAAGRLNPDAARINLGTGLLGGSLPGGPTTPLTPGVYTFGTDVSISGNLHFNGDGVYIIQIAGSLIQAAGYNVILEGGALAKNIFWQVAGHVEVGANAHMEGIILGKTAVTFVTESSLNGRILAQTACVLQKATITQPV